MLSPPKKNVPPHNLIYPKAKLRELCVSKNDKVPDTLLLRQKRHTRGFYNSYLSFIQTEITVQ